MDDHAGLLAAVLAEPQDDGLRLVYADYLEERNGPGDAARAEFVRVQVALEPLRIHGHGTKNPHKGECATCLKVARLERQEAKLWGRSDSPGYPATWFHIPNWACLAGKPKIHIGWSPPDDCFILGEVRRGFVEHVTCTAADCVAHLDAILAAQPVREVTLTTWLPLDERFSPDGFAEYRLKGRTVWVGIDDDRRGKTVEEFLLAAEWPRVRAWHLPP